MIEITCQNQVTVIKMARGKVNAMNLEFCQKLASALKTVQEDDSVAAVLMGNDRVFSAGVDLREVVERDNDYLDQYLPALIESFKAVFQFRKPLVAAVSGHAIAGGCILASACDLRLIHDRARIGLPELRIGVPLPNAAIEIMRFAVAPAALRTIVNVGRTYRGQDAVDVGLADEVVSQEQLLEAAVDAALGLTVVPPNVFWLGKQQLRAPVIRNIELNEKAFGQQVLAIWKSPENRKIVEAYVAERL